jgi:hypothetical protein
MSRAGYFLSHVVGASEIDRGVDQDHENRQQKGQFHQGTSALALKKALNCLCASHVYSVSAAWAPEEPSGEPFGSDE